MVTPSVHYVDGDNDQQSAVASETADYIDLSGIHITTNDITDAAQVIFVNGVDFASQLINDGTSGRRSRAF